MRPKGKQKIMEVYPKYNFASVASAVGGGSESGQLSSDRRVGLGDVLRIRSRSAITIQKSVKGPWGIVSRDELIMWIIHVLLPYR